MTQRLQALGLMSGTSMDGVDAACVLTDGETDIVAQGEAYSAYDASTRKVLRAAMVLAADLPTPILADLALWPDALIEADALVTQKHIEAVQDFCHQHASDAPIDIIGLHGQTIVHRPDEGFTLQLGDGQALAQAVGINVVAQFRHADLAAGGQGAPLAPLFHAALLEGAPRAPRAQAVINLGGIANMTWLGKDVSGEDNAILAFDSGPANALIDDWVLAHTGEPFDKDGALAARGQVDETVLARLMADDYFALSPPKSLDRLAFAATHKLLEALSPADGAATLTAFTAHSIVAGLALCAAQFHTQADRIILCGGGRRNKTLCAMLEGLLAADIIDCDMLGWHGDALEAQLFAWLAVRSVYGLPLSRPETTGVKQPVSGGVLFKA
jgi:anhydro-N-acetylmuramic acid kinase